MVQRKWKLAGSILCVGVAVCMLASNLHTRFTYRPMPLPLKNSLDSNVQSEPSPRGASYVAGGFKKKFNDASLTPVTDIQDKITIQKGAPIKDVAQLEGNNDRNGRKMSVSLAMDGQVKEVVRMVPSPRDMVNKTDGDLTKRKAVTWSPAMDVLDENTVLKDAPLKDIKEMADLDKSTYYTIDPKPSYEVGDEIKIGIQLYDGFGRRKIVGGDRLIVRIYEDSLRANATGYILDHMDGTYTAVVKCLWKGTPNIQVALDFPRQVIRVFYQQLNTASKQSKNICARFWSFGNFSENEYNAVYKTGGSLIQEVFKILLVSYNNDERQHCQPTQQLLNTSKPVCDMADRNGGMSWFCIAPTSKEITCDDVKMFLHKEFLTPVNGMLMKIERTFFPPINITVKGQITAYNKSTRKPPCVSYNKTQLWFLPSPVGYFIHDEWKIGHCTAPSKEKLPGCLKNKHFVVFGDSTTRQWVRNLCSRFILRSTTQRVIVDGVVFKSDFSRYGDSLNLTVDWVEHSLPGNVYRNGSTSIAKHIHSYGDRTNMVFVIHIYAHIITNHHSVWRDRLRQIRQSIELFLQKNTDAKFLIKGGNAANKHRLFRYANYLYRVILIEEFKGLYGKVIYLDTADATIASGGHDLHPNEMHVTGMVNQMLAYICH